MTQGVKQGMKWFSIGFSITLAALTLLLLGADWTRTSTKSAAPSAKIDYGSSGDSVKEGVQILDNSMDDVYTKLNLLHTLQAGSSYSGTPNTNEVFMDTDGPQLKYYDGADWQNLGSSGLSSSGISMDATQEDMSRNIWLVRGSATSAQLSCTEVAPCTISIAGITLQNTTTTSVTVSSVGDYEIYAKRDGTSANFLIYSGSYPHTQAADEKNIGRAIHSGSDFLMLSSHEYYYPKTRNPIPYMFWLYVDGGSPLSVTQNSFTAITGTEYYDPWNVLASGTFTAPETGWYRFEVGCRWDAGDFVNGDDIQLQSKLVLNGTTQIGFEGIYNKKVLGVSAGTSDRFTTYLTRTAYLTASNTVVAYCGQDNTQTTTETTSADTDDDEYATYFKGEYLGRKF